MKKLVWILFAAAVLLPACGPEPEKYQGKQPDTNTEDHTETPPGDITCTTEDATDIKYFEATLHGKVQTEETAWKAFYYSDNYSTEEELVANGTKVTVTGTSSVETVISNLLMGKRYYFLLEGKTIDKTVYGGVRYFDVPTIRCSTTAAFDITRIKASVGGAGIYDESLLGDSPLTGKICYSATQTQPLSIANSGTTIPCELTVDGSIWADLTGLSVNQKYYYVAVLTYRGQNIYGDVLNFTTKALPAGAVDLGLSVLWTDRNLGASSATGFGNYYCWGEKKTKSNYTREAYTGPTHTYKDGENLLPSDDVAYDASSGRRMPTSQEWEELIKKNGVCTQKWDTQDGVTGIRFTSTKTKNSIFLPMAGYKDGTDVIGTGNNYQSQCRYWTATLAFHNSGDIPTGYAYICKKSESTSSYYFGSWSSSSSYYGCPIRPVYD